MKVWGVALFIHGQQVRCIVAANTQKQAAELLRCPVWFLRRYGAVTANPREVEIAHSAACEVFYTPHDNSTRWFKRDTR